MVRIRVRVPQPPKKNKQGKKKKNWAKRLPEKGSVQGARMMPSKSAIGNTGVYRRKGKGRGVGRQNGPSHHCQACSFNIGGVTQNSSARQHK